jgi:hypothetical protein
MKTCFHVFMFSMFSGTRHWLEASGQLHSSATLTLWNVSLGIRLRAPEPVCTAWRREYYYWYSKSDPSAIESVALRCPLLIRNKKYYPGNPDNAKLYDVTLCSWVDVYTYFGGSYCCHLQYQKVVQSYVRVFHPSG